MTSSEQDKIIEALAAEHGAVKVLPLRGTDAVLACGVEHVVRVADEVVARLAKLEPRDLDGWCTFCRCHEGHRDDCLWLLARDDWDLADADAESRGKWWYVPADPARAIADEPSLRYAYEQEIADAHEQDAVRELLSAAGLR
jgi:hypothetical protein